MGLLNRLSLGIRMAMSPRFDQFISEWMAGGGEYRPRTVGVDDIAMKYSAVWACFRVLAETFASVPVFEYKKLKNGDREKTDDTGIYELLHTNPNPLMSAYNWHEASMYQICAGGNAISRRINTNGFLDGLMPIAWDRVEIVVDKNTGRIVYKIDGGKEILGREEVFHIPGPSMNGIVGMSVLEYAGNAIKLGKTYDTFGQRFYENGAMPSGIFKHPGALKDDAYERLKKDIRERYQGIMNTGEPILAEDGLDFKELTIKPIDAQMLESKKYQVEDICRFCRVPLHLVQSLDHATNNNIEHQSLEFVMYTMLPHFKRAEECINSQLLTREQRREGYYFEYNISGLLRGDAKSMAESFALGRNSGYLSVNDIRRMLNMNAIPNGDIYLQPMNMVEAGTIPEPKEIEKPVESDDDTDENVGDDLKKEISALIEIGR